VFPPFTESEMAFVAQHVWPQRAAGWQDRAAQCGYVPRLVFELSDDAAKRWFAETQSFIRNLNVERCTLLLNEVLITGVTDRLLLYCPADNSYRLTTSVIRSAAIDRAIHDVAWDRLLSAAQSIVATTREGFGFENACLTLLLEGGANIALWQIEQLYQASPALLSRDDLLNPRGLKHAGFLSNHALELEGNTLYRPLIPNFELIDAFKYTPAEKRQGRALLVLYQSTLARRHAPTVSTVDRFIKRFNVGTAFVVGKDKDRARIVAGGRSGVQLQIGAAAGRVPLDVAMVFITRAAIGRQTLAKGEAVTEDARQGATRLWEQTRQFRVEVVFRTGP
jgi:hypothetical protein